jgi:hypothetical protein
VVQATDRAMRGFLSFNIKNGKGSLTYQLTGEHNLFPSFEL